MPVKKNDFGPAALVAAFALGVAAMIWAATSQSHGAELPTQWKIGMAVTAKPDPAKPPVLLTFGLTDNSWPSEDECKKALADPTFTANVAALTKDLTEHVGTQVTIDTACVDAAKFKPEIPEGEESL